MADSYQVECICVWLLWSFIFWHCSIKMDVCQIEFWFIRYLDQFHLDVQ